MARSKWTPNLSRGAQNTTCTLRHLSTGAESIAHARELRFFVFPASILVIFFLLPYPFLCAPISGSPAFSPPGCAEKSLALRRLRRIGSAEATAKAAAACARSPAACCWCDRLPQSCLKGLAPIASSPPPHVRPGPRHEPRLESAPFPPFRA